jgi:RNA polymerase sigma-70 factor (ECF subfamily)
VSSAAHRRLLEAFLNAARTGDLAALEELFASDVVSYSDGGGAVRGAARIPVTGRTRVAKLTTKAFSPRFWPGAEITWAEANGRPAAMVLHGETITALVTISASAQGIDQIMLVMNPAKLGGFHWRRRSRTTAAPY